MSILIGYLLFTNVKLTRFSWTSFADTLDFSSVQTENLIDPDIWRIENDITSEEEVFLTSQDADQIIGRWPYGSCNTVYADSDYVYIGSGGWIIIVDMTDPASPVEISRIATPGVVWRLFRSGDYLYVANRWGGLRIIDMSDPSNPSEIGSFYTTTQVWSVYILGNHAYVGWEDTQGNEYFSVVDISDPTNPVEISNYAWVRVLDIYVSDNLAYVGDSNLLRIFNISDPSNPVEISSTPFMGGMYTQIDVSGGYAYVTSWWHGFYIFNVSDPTNPVEVAHLNYTVENPVYVWDVQVSNGYAYVDLDRSDLNEFSGSFRILDVSDPSNPIEKCQYVLADGFPNQVGSDWEDLYIYGDYAYITYTYGGLRVLDISDPTNPVKVGYFVTSGSVYDVYVEENYAYVVNDDLHILDISEPSNPVEIGGVYTEERDAFSVFVSEGFAYVAGTLGFRMFNVSDPTNIIEVNLTNVMEFPTSPGTRYQSIYVADNYAYFLQHATGLRILDVGDPMHPVEVGSFQVPDDREHKGIYVSGNYAYVTYGGGSQFHGLRIIDVSNRSNPVEIGSLETPEHHSGGVYFSDGYAYMCSHRVTPDGTDLLRIIDVQDPSSPVEVSSYDTGAYECFEVFVSDDYAYVAVGDGLQIIYIGDPSHPVEAQRVKGLLSVGLDVSDGYIYLADIDYGLVILREKPLSFLMEMWSFSTGDDVYSSPALGDVDGDSQVEIVIGSMDNNTYCLDGATGNEEWTFTAGGKMGSSPALGDVDGDGQVEIVIGSDDYKVYCLDGATGAQEWAFTTGGEVSSNPALGDVDGDGQVEVMIGSQDHRVYCLTGASGNEEWSSELTGDVTAPALGDVDGDGQVEVIVSKAGELAKTYCLDGATGDEEWVFSGGDVSFKPALGDVDGDGQVEVVIGSADNSTYCLDGVTGVQEWAFTTGFWVRSSPVLGDVDGDGDVEIVIGSMDYNVYCLDGATGNEEWVFTTELPVRGSAAALGDIDKDNQVEVVIGSEDHNVYCLDGVTGNEEWFFNTGGRVWSSPALGDVNGDGQIDVVIGSADHRVYCLTLISKGDFTPPQITDITRSPTYPQPTDTITIRATVSDAESDISSVIVSYSTDDGSSWSHQAMTGVDSLYSTTIGPFDVGIIQYYVNATDSVGNSQVSDTQSFSVVEPITTTEPPTTTTTKTTSAPSITVGFRLLSVLAIIVLLLPIKRSDRKI